MQSPGFSKFREWITNEFLIEKETEEKINHMIDSNGYILFFKKDKDVFGAGEDSRLVFAKMKSPDEDMPKRWKDEASFSADNLNKSVKGEPSQHVFNNDDLKEMDVIDREEAVKALKKVAEKAGDTAFPKAHHILDISKFLQHDPDDAPNFVRTDEK